MSDTQGSADVTPSRPADETPTSSQLSAPHIEAEPTMGLVRRLATANPLAFFVTLLIFVLGKAWLMRVFAIHSRNPLGVLPEAALLVFVMGVFELIRPRRWYWVDLVPYTVLSVLLFAITVYVHFYAQLFDPSMMAMAGQLGSVSGVVLDLIKPVYLLLFIDIPFLAYWAYVLQRYDGQQRSQTSADSGPDAPSQTTRWFAHRGLGLVALTLVAGAIATFQLVSVSRVPSYVDGVALAKARGLTVAQAAVFLPHTLENMDDPSHDVLAPTVHAAGVSSALSLDATAAATPAAKMEARIERIRGSLQGSRIATFVPGAYKGKNLIIIQVEALNEMIENRTIDGHVITPNLNKLISQSWYFPNTYAETGIGNTADAEFTVNSSLFSPRAQAASVAYADKTVPGLPRLLNDMGYDTFTMHTNAVAYWNRKELYGALGFKHFYDREFFRNPDHSVPDKIAMGSSDEILFQKVLPELARKDASSTPFYAQVITLSSHTPFDAIPQSRRPVKTPPEYAGSLFGNYVSAQSYMDKALGEFLDGLKANGVWDDSVIVLYGDHTAAMDAAPTGVDSKVAKALLGREYGPADRQRVSLVIHLPGQNKEIERKDVLGEIDVMPTVADLLGVNLSQVPHMGRSAFVASNALVPFNSYLPGGSYANDRVVFMPGLGYDDATAVNVADSTPAKITSREKTDYERGIQLTALSDMWVKSLPKRADAGSLWNAWIPDPKARKAAAPYGAKQKGTGSVAK